MEGANPQSMQGVNPQGQQDGGEGSMEGIKLYIAVQKGFKQTKTCMEICGLDDYATQEIDQKDAKCFYSCVGLYTDISKTYKDSFTDVYSKAHGFMQDKIVKE